MTLCEAVEKMPLSPLIRKVKQETNWQQLDDLLNSIMQRMADGYRAQWGRHGLNDLDSLLGVTQRRISQLSTAHTKGLSQRKALVTARPYLDPSLSQYDPRGSHEQATKQPPAHKGTGQTVPASATSKARRRARRSVDG